MQVAADSLLRRARPALGTLVDVQVRIEGIDAMRAQAAVDAAFDAISLVHDRMSAHDARSDLARVARAQPGARVPLHPHTAAVLRLAQGWTRASNGAFDPHAAGRRLAHAGLRPAIVAGAGAPGRFLDARMGDDTIDVDGPLTLDLGGIAKGYAVDRAVDALRAHGIASGLVNAGGDMRAFGPHAWRVDVQHAVVRARSRRLLRLTNAAIATSARVGDAVEFVPTRRGAARWSQCTVLARDCASADALTKWGLQAPEPSLRLRTALTRLGARLWRE